MRKIKKHIIFIFVLLIGVFLYYKYKNSITIEQQFILNLKTKQSFSELLIKDDTENMDNSISTEEALGELIVDFINHYDDTHKLVMETNNIDEKQKQVKISDLTTNNILVLNERLEDGKWKIILNIKKTIELKKTKKNIEKFDIKQLSSEEFLKLINLYKKLAELENGNYDEIIKDLTSKMKKMQDKESMINNVEIKCSLNKKNLLECLIFNKSSFKIKKISGNFLKSNNISPVFDIFSINESNLIYNTALESNYQIKVFIKNDLQFSNKDTIIFNITDIISIDE